MNSSSYFLIAIFTPQKLNIGLFKRGKLISFLFISTTSRGPTRFNPKRTSDSTGAAGRQDIKKRHLTFLHRKVHALCPLWFRGEKEFQASKVLRELNSSSI